MGFTSLVPKQTDTDAMLESSKDLVLVSLAFWAKKLRPSELSKMPQKSITTASQQMETAAFLASRFHLVFQKRPSKNLSSKLPRSVTWSSAGSGCEMEHLSAETPPSHKIVIFISTLVNTNIH